VELTVYVHNRKVGFLNSVRSRCCSSMYEWRIKKFYFYVPQYRASVQTGLGANTAPCIIGTGGKAARAWR